MWTVSRIVAMVILTGLSFMDYKIRKVPRDVLLLCMAGTVLYQAVTQNIDFWKFLRLHFLFWGFLLWDA